MDIGTKGRVVAKKNLQKKRKGSFGQLRALSSGENTKLPSFQGMRMCNIIAKSPL